MSETIKGRLYCHSEQGVGPFWAFQDEKNIHKDSSIWGGERWDYDGLHPLELGDYLKVLDSKGKVLFDGVIMFGSASAGAFPRWYPKGINKREWSYFFKNDSRVIAELTPSGVPRRIRWAVSRYMANDNLIHVESWLDLHNVIVVKYFSDPEKISVRLNLSFLTRRERCNCINKKTEKGRWRKEVPKEFRYCSCENKPDDLVLLGIAFI